MTITIFVVIAIIDFRTSVIIVTTIISVIIIVSVIGAFIIAATSSSSALVVCTNGNSDCVDLACGDRLLLATKVLAFLLSSLSLQILLLISSLPLSFSSLLSTSLPASGRTDDVVADHEKGVSQIVGVYQADGIHRHQYHYHNRHLSHKKDFTIAKSCTTTTMILPSKGKN